MQEREPTSFPTNHISREDLTSVDPTRKAAIDALTESDMGAIANEIGEAVNDMFWTAAAIVLDRHLAPTSDPSSPTHEQDPHQITPREEQIQSPETLIAVKDAIVNAFHALPPEHQATMSLVIVGKVMEGEWGDWLQDALNRLYPSQEVTTATALQFPSVTREQLRQTTVNPDDVDILTDDDLATIAINMHNHYIHDLFWDELQFHTETMLETKRSATDSTNANSSPTIDTTG